MALLKFEPPQELTPLRVKIARPVHERVERYREFCGALELADLVERALVYVMDRDADFRAHENRSATPREKVEGRGRANRVELTRFRGHLILLIWRCSRCPSLGRRTRRSIATRSSNLPAPGDRSRRSPRSSSRPNRRSATGLPRPIATPANALTE